MHEMMCPIAMRKIEFYGKGDPLDDGREYSQVSPCRGCTEFGHPQPKFLSIMVVDGNVVACMPTELE